MRKTRQQKIEKYGSCRVYWGSHGCSKHRGHWGIHYCDSGCWIPDEATHLYGEDAPKQEEGP